MPWLLVTLALAHPLSRDRYSLRAAIRVEQDRADVVVVLEVPFDRVMQDLRGGLDAAGVRPEASAPAREVLDRYNAAMWRQMADHLLLLVDGRPVAATWRPSDSRYNGKGAVTEGFFVYIVELAPDAPLQLGRQATLTLVDTGWPDAPMAYSAYVGAGKGWTVTDSSARGVMPDRPYDLNDPSFWVTDP
ncbi:MAG TPA: hypothetical protein PKC57_12250, partial [Microthrixaceae bacterium]|nr:hypothetical protein [Microthrixaceae bacterium]